jgi:uncharacterized membrane protein YciS (DUF1049 family)
MASGKTESSGGFAILGILGIFIYWGFKKLAGVSALKIVMFIVGVIGCITLIVGFFWYFDRTKTEPRERTVRRPDRRFNVGYREEQETYQAVIPLSSDEIEQTKRTGLRIMIVGLLMALCLIAPWIATGGNTSAKTTRYITTESGMNLRLTPSVTGKQIRVIPYKAAIEVLELGQEETIYGKTANWLKIRHDGQTGWIWGYFTSTEEP